MHGGKPVPDRKKLKTLAHAIAASADDEGRWEISAEQVERHLSVDPVSLWRAAYEVRDRIAFRDAIDGWSCDTVGDLITVLEHLMGPAAEQEMARTGLFLPYEWCVELTESLLARARRFSADHVIRTDAWKAMLRYKRSVAEALLIYFGEYVDVEALTAECAESFQTLRDLPRVAAATAVLYLKRLFTRHVLEARALFALLEKRLKAAAEDLGFVDKEESARARARPAQRRESSLWARGVMGVEQVEITAELLRERYRVLMMRYHPDADPTGLERCKDVNVAYSLLIAEVAVH